MTRLIKTVVSALCLASFGYAQATVTSTNFIPVVLHEDISYRLSTAFAFTPRPSAELEFGYVHALGAGFDYGVGLHGGVQDLKCSGILGLDLMIRFLRAVNEVSFLGWHGQVGYAYTGLGDPGVSINAGSAFPITTGLIIGGIVRDITQFYFFPAVEFGQTMNPGDTLWKSGIGLRFTLGSVISIGEKTHLFLETQPRIANFTSDQAALSTFSINATLGLLFDF